MSSLDLYREQRKERTERLRGWMIYLLYKARPRLLECDALLRLLDRRNFPLSRRRLAEELEYLHSLRLIRIEVAGNESQKLTDRIVLKLLQQYADSDTERMSDVICARLTAAGINFQEGVGPHFEGIARIE